MTKCLCHSLIICEHFRFSLRLCKFLLCILMIMIKILWLFELKVSRVRTFKYNIMYWFFNRFLFKVQRIIFLRSYYDDWYRVSSLNASWGIPFSCNKLVRPVNKWFIRCWNEFYWIFSFIFEWFILIDWFR